MKSLRHPVAGRLTLRTEALTFPDDPDQTLFVFLADPGSPSDEALRMLAAWAGGQGRQDAVRNPERSGPPG
ncbi:hypothetical protein JT723_31015 [Streptomyces bryophytorum]|nr:hypothetical protein [Actinacidiphila bryophytorum]MBN6546955.1 hypothetical protein [Actinacidiphila bryophytorum]